MAQVDLYFYILESKFLILLREKKCKPRSTAPAGYWTQEVGRRREGPDTDSTCSNGSSGQRSRGAHPRV